MLTKSTLISLAVVSLSLPLMADPPRRPEHNRPHNPSGRYHEGYRGHHHNWESRWHPWRGHSNPWSYKCVARDSRWSSFEGFGWEAGEKALDQCYRYSEDPDECRIDWCG